MSIYLRIRELRDVKKMNQASFAAALGASQAAISRYEKGERVPDSEFLSKLSSIFGVNTNWILTGEGDMFNQVASPSRVRVPLVEIPVVAPIAAGSPLEVYEDEPLEIIQVPASLLNLPPPYFAFKVEGESMSPFILDGDIVILSRNWRGTKINNHICGFRTPDGITLKKLVLQPRQKTAWLMPLNHTYDPTPYNKDTKELNLFGVLVLSIRKYL